jgi:hypothetical protein
MDHENSKEHIKRAIKEQYQRDLPLMDVERMKGELSGQGLLVGRH